MHFVGAYDNSSVDFNQKFCFNQKKCFTHNKQYMASLERRNTTGEKICQCKKKYKYQQINGMTGRYQPKKETSMRVVWSPAEESVLLDLWHEKVEELRSGKKNSLVFQEIADKLQNAGFCGRWEDIRTKVDNLTRRYRQEETKIELADGSPSSWEHYHKVNHILGSSKPKKLHTVTRKNYDRQKVNITSETEHLKKETSMRVVWSAAEESMLLDLWHEKIGELRGIKKNSLVFQEIAARLQDAGFCGNWVDIRTKVDNLTRKYRQEKAKIGPKGRASSSWEHYNKVNNILGSFRLKKLHNISGKKYICQKINTMRGAAQSKKKKIKRVVWSADEESILIDLWHEKIEELRGTKKNSIVFQEIAAELQEAGFSGSWVDIRTKLDNLTRKYRQEIAKIGHKGKASSWHHYHKVHNILGSFRLRHKEETTLESTDNSSLLVELKTTIEPDALDCDTEQSRCSSSCTQSQPEVSQRRQPKKRKFDFNAEMVRLARERNDMQRQMNQELRQRMDDIVKRLDSISSQNGAFQNELFSILWEKKYDI